MHGDAVLAGQRHFQAQVQAIALKHNRHGFAQTFDGAHLIGTLLQRGGDGLGIVLTAEVQPCLDAFSGQSRRALRMQQDATDLWVFTKAFECADQGIERARMGR
ncbi:hypothetical protein SDC9_124641 [bioreactor metagenome]|uniref:Uncharacterized protein n=1 Tax=bioreactor metagenome TaxID=1076179 RepID=A0A645CL24_9ZZZZ